MGGTGTKINPLGVTDSVGQDGLARREHILRMGEIKGHIPILGPGEMQLHIVVELRREVGISFLDGIGVHVRSEGIEHPVIRSFDTACIGSRNGYRLLDFAQRFGGITDIRRGEGIEIGLVDD